MIDEDGGVLVKLPVSEGRRDHNVEQAEAREMLPALVPDRDWSARQCRHLRVDLDPKNRRCVCECGQIIEAYDFLLMLGQHWKAELRQYHEMRRERAEISKRLVELRREEANTKSRLRNARKNLGRVEREDTVARLG